MSDIREKQFADTLTKMKELRQWGFQNNISPWVFRQVLLFMIFSDTKAAKVNNITEEMLRIFDEQCNREHERIPLE